MTTAKIKLSTIEDIRNFVNIMMTNDVEADLHLGRYTVDASSLMGIFSLDLLKPLELLIHRGDSADILKKIDQYIVK